MTDQNPPQISVMPGMNTLEAVASAVPLNLRLEANWKVRIFLLRMLGGAMVLSSAGLWLTSDGAADPEMALIRVGVSVVFLLIGLVLLTAHEAGHIPEACFDPVRQELRVLQCDSKGRPRTVLRRSYDSLGGARLTASSLQMFEADGSLLIELPVRSAAIRSELRDQLSGSVQLMT